MKRLHNLLANNKGRGSFKAEDNTLFLYDVIVGDDAEAAWFGGISPGSFAKALSAMSGTVHLRINSPGGDVFGGVAMAQAMREYNGEIIAHVDGYAASIASIIAIAADRIVMAPGSFMMIHNAWTMAIGNAADLMQTAALLAKIDGTLAESYATKSRKQDIAAFGDMMAQETWFTAQEAIDCGLADEIAPEAEQPDAKLAAWDLSAFDAAPKPAGADEAADHVAAQRAHEAALSAAAAATTKAKAAADAAAALAADQAATAETERRQRITAARLLRTAA